ncbi:MAG: hypothetical protein GY720_14785 [bacterium]|nr:hypothetical protein [bacterium]
MITHRRALLIGALLSLFMAACSGGDTPAQSQPPTTEEGPATDPTPSTSTAADDSVAADQVIVVDLSAVFGGFLWHVVEASTGESLGTPTVRVSIDVENLTAEASRPPSRLSLRTSAGLIENSGFGITADIAPSAVESGNYEFRVDAGFTFDGAVLLIGRDGRAQASVPLAGGEVVSLDPIEVTVDGVGTAEAVEIWLSQVGVEWHSLAVHGGSAEVGTAFLTATIDITLGDQSRTAKDTFELVVPNGQTVTPERAPNEVLHAGVTAEGLDVAFIIPDPVDGNYVLRLLNLSRFPEDTVAEIPFTIGE